MTVRRGRGWERLAEGLSERDWVILQDLARLRLATGRQLQRLHVADGSPLTRTRRTRSILQRLSDNGLLVRLERQVGGVHAGSSGYTYGLSAAGQRLTSLRGPAGGVRLRRPWEPAPGFVDHVLLVSELYVRLREAEAAKLVELLAFETEPACWRWWHEPSGERRVLKPDAFVRLGVDDVEHVSFVEIDRATESTTVLRRKAETYVAYWRSGEEQAREGVFPRCLWLVPSAKRLEQLSGVLGRLDPDAWRLFQVASFDEAVWALAGRPPPRRPAESQLPKERGVIDE